MNVSCGTEMDPVYTKAFPDSVRLYPIERTHEFIAEADLTYNDPEEIENPEALKVPVDQIVPPVEKDTPGEALEALISRLNILRL